jgi:hypothetical protein
MAGKQSRAIVNEPVKSLEKSVLKETVGKVMAFYLSDVSSLGCVRERKKRVSVNYRLENNA